jgi:hypothetical protein
MDLDGLADGSPALCKMPIEVEDLRLSVGVYGGQNQQHL